MDKWDGFTLLELLVAISIVGILAAVSAYGVSRFVLEMRSEQHVLAFHSELKSLRALAIKDNERYLVHLNRTASDYYVTIDEDKDYDYTIGDWNAGKLNAIRTSFNSVAGSGFLTFGVPDPVPSSPAVPDYSMMDSWPIRGEWNQMAITLPSGASDNTWYRIVFEPDELGSINNGIIYLRNSSVPKVGYAIFKTPGINEILLYKWNGSKWYKM